jgi:hypothetical protein
MFDRRDRAIVNVRIHSKLRWRRNGNGNRGTRHRGDVGHDGNIGNVDIIGNVNHVRDAANLGHVGNVRFRLEQHCFIVGANGAHNPGRRRSNRNSLGIYRDRQSWGQLRGSRTDDKRAAHCGHGGTAANDAHHHLSAHRFICDDKQFPMPNHRAYGDAEHSGWLLKQPSTVIWTGYENENDHPLGPTDCRHCGRRTFVRHA